MNKEWLDEFEQALAALAVKPEPTEYRIYYNDAGDITSCSSCQHPTQGQYLVVSRDQYSDYFRFRINVKKKMLEKIDIDPGVRLKLQKSHCGYPVVRGHASLIVEDKEQYQDIEHYAKLD